jgi:N-acetylglucosaminyl-diphospho-decaprenol L-rhamnosyltransferase
MDVTVSIVNHSAKETLLELLESLRPAAEGPLELEIVLLDNASDDGSAEAVSDRFPDVRVIRQSFRDGFGTNHNRVIRETSGRHVYLLSHDARVVPGGLERMVAYLDANPGVALLAPRIRRPDGRPQASAWRFPSPVTAALGALTLARAGVVQSKGDAPRRVDWAMGCALLVRREALERVGLFDEGFFMYSEETDLARRLADGGWETHFFPGATVIHRDSALRAAVPQERLNEAWRSRRRYLRKHLSPRAARTSELLLSAEYALRGLAGTVLRDRAFARQMFHSARCAWNGVPGRGLRELAEEWNRDHEPARR